MKASQTSHSLKSHNIFNDFRTLLFTQLETSKKNYNFLDRYDIKIYNEKLNLCFLQYFVKFFIIFLTLYIFCLFRQFQF